MLTCHFFSGYEGDRGVIGVEIVGHGDDLLGYPLGIRTLLQHHIHLPCVLLPSGETAFAFAHGVDSLLHGDGVLSGVGYAFDASNCVRMSLAYTLAPECIILTVWKNCI